ncbi:MAG: hypothetical protein ABMA64_20760 [Myxococcota bacterium]
MHRWFLLCAIGCRGVGDSPADTSDLTGDSGAPSPPLAIALLIDASPSMIGHVEALVVGLADVTFPPDSRVSVATLDGEGAPVGDPITEDHQSGVLEQVLCEATCFVDDPADDPGYSCGDPVRRLSKELLDCVCPANWTGNCGAALEQGLASAANAIADPTVVPDGYDPRVVVISDEGDGSVDLPAGDPGLGRYGSALGGTRFSAIAPGLDPSGSVACPGPSSDWGVQRYDAMATRAGGRFESLLRDDCEPANVATALSAIVDAW